MEISRTSNEGNEEVTEECVSKRSNDTILIKIIDINDIPYIWDADEYMILRSEHRILGTLDGVSSKPFKGAHYFAQSQTLPIRLSRFEAHYMVKHGIALAFRIPVLNQVQPQIGREQVEQLKEDRKNEELEVHRNKRRLQIESMVDKIIEGKRRKGRGLVPDRNTVIQEEMQKVELPYDMTQIDLMDPWVKDADFIPCDIPLPSCTLLDRLRYKVFEDFLQRKFYVATGLKFGGDFLAYPGDPIDYHSQFLIVCHDKSRGASPPYVHKQTRLASIVRKVLVVAFLDEENDNVKYVVMNEVKVKAREKIKSGESLMSVHENGLEKLNHNVEATRTGSSSEKGTDDALT